MPFIQTSVEKKIELKRESNPEFKKNWDESRAEYKLIGEMISLRKKESKDSIPRYFLCVMI